MSLSRQVTLASALLLSAGAVVLLLIIVPASNGSADEPAKASPAATESHPTRDRPAPPAAKESVKEREKMVRSQIERPWDLRGRVRNKAVCDAMRAVPRHAFVPEGDRSTLPSAS